MKVRLIGPARKSDWAESFWDGKRFEQIVNIKSGGLPLALPILAALTPSDIDVRIIDENVEQIDFDEKVDLVGITFLTGLAPRAYEIADAYRAKGVTVVLGGIHVSMLPDEAILHADSIVIGEAEEIWPQLINDYKNDDLKKIYKAEQRPDILEAPLPRWDIVDTDKYIYLTVQIGRGCPNDCDFCSVREYNGRKYRHKSIEQIIKEIETLKSLNPSKSILIADDNILSKPSFAKELFKAIEPLGIKFTTQASIDRLDNDENLELLYKAGCRHVFIGFESVEQEGLNAINKARVNNIDRYKRVVDKIHASGIEVFASFILGLDQDVERTRKSVYNFMQETSIAFAMINVLTPLPGTRLFDRMQDEGRIKTKQWELYDLENVCAKLNTLDDEGVIRERIKLLADIYAYPAIYARLKSLANKGVYKGEDLLSKNSILLLLHSLVKLKLDRAYFLARCLYGVRSVDLGAVIYAMNFHEYVDSLKRANS